MLEITVKDGLSLSNQIALSVLLTILYLVERIQQHASHEAQLNLTHRRAAIRAQRHAGIILQRIFGNIRLAEVIAQGRLHFFSGI